MPRKYIKRSEYWGKFQTPNLNNNLSELNGAQEDSVEPQFCGSNYYSHASYKRNQPSSGASSGRYNKVFKSNKQYRYKNIHEGLLPFESNGDNLSIRECIELCQKAYANVAIFRNAVDIMAEFANSEIHLEGGTEPAKKFIEKWLDRAKIWNIKDQFFREYYRSGNVFFYRVDGKFNADDFQKINSIYGSSIPTGKIPIRYILLNPYDIVAARTTSFNKGDYRKVLSEYELDRLRNPTTQEDKELLQSLPQKTQEEIKRKGFSRDGIFMDLDPKKLSHCFYKKQDYEPFAIPFGFAVLDDINWKLELKKIDQAISRTVENVILMITMGAKPDDGGINPRNLQAMQSLFQNESVGRVLVSDYTTKADFIIPDINKVLGSEKYKVVNEDIRDALQNVIVGQEKYANTQVKAQIFLERLKEARNAFLNDFLQPQIKLICRAMGFRKFPKAKFESIDIKDEVQLQRVATRLIELGVLTPDQGIKTIQTGVYPDSEDMRPAQEKYVEDREQGMYNPLIGGVPAVEPAGAEENRALQEKTQKATSLERKRAAQQQTQQQNNVPNQVGRPSGATASYSQKNIQDVVYEIEAFRKTAESFARKHYKKKKLSEDQKQNINNLIESIVCAKDITDWAKTYESCIKDHSKIAGLSLSKDIQEISAAHQLPSYAASILYHSSKK
jgi:hypothetical protein